MIIVILNRILKLCNIKLGDTDLQISDNQLQEISWLGGGQIVTLLLSLVSIKVMTTIGPFEYGKFILTTSVGGILTLGFFGPLEQGFIRYYFEYTKDAFTRKIFLDSLLKVLAISGSLLFVIGIGIFGIAYTHYRFDPFFYFSSVVMIVVAVVSVPINGMMNAMRLRREVSIIQVVEKIVIILSMVTMIYVWSLWAATAVVCVAFATFISLYVRLIIYLRESKIENLTSADEAVGTQSIKKSIFKNITKYSTPFLWWGGFSWLQLNGERWIINGFMTNADVGRYGLAASVINNSIVVAVNVVAQYLSPIIFAKFSDASPASRAMGMKIIKFQGWITFILFLSFAIILFFGGNFIIHLLSTKDFSIEGAVLFVLTLGVGIFYIAQSMISVGLALNRPEIYIVPKIATAVVSVVAYYFGCMHYGIFGIAVAIFLVNCFYFLLIVYINNRYLKNTQ